MSKISFIHLLLRVQHVLDMTYMLWILNQMSTGLSVKESGKFEEGPHTIWIVN